MPKAVEKPAGLRLGWNRRDHQPGDQGPAAAKSREQHEYFSRSLLTLSFVKQSQSRRVNDLCPAAVHLEEHYGYGKFVRARSCA
jgi:hypothetical protein